MRGKERKRSKRIDYLSQFYYLLRSVADEEGLRLKEEYKFLKDRKFRFDYAFEEVKVAFEYEGIFSRKSRHLTVTGYSRDIEKYNLAQAEGWVVIRATPLVLKKANELAEIIKKVVRERKKLLQSKKDEENAGGG